MIMAYLIMPLSNMICMVSKGCVYIGSPTIEIDVFMYCIFIMRPTLAYSYSTWNYIACKYSAAEEWLALVVVDGIYLKWVPYSNKVINKAGCLVSITQTTYKYAICTMLFIMP